MTRPDPFRSPSTDEPTMPEQLYTLEMWRGSKRLGSLMFLSPKPDRDTPGWTMNYCQRFIDQFHDWDVAELKAVRPGVVNEHGAHVLTTATLVHRWER